MHVGQTSPQGPLTLQVNITWTLRSGLPTFAAAERLALPKTYQHAPCIYLITLTAGLLQCVWMLYLMTTGTYRHSPKRVGIHTGLCQVAGWQFRVNELLCSALGTENVELPFSCKLIYRNAVTASRLKAVTSELQAISAGRGSKIRCKRIKLLSLGLDPTYPLPQ